MTGTNTKYFREILFVLSLSKYRGKKERNANGFNCLQ